MNTPELDKSAKARLAFMDANYDPLITYHLNDKKKVHLGERDNRVCRFCKKKTPDVNFQNIAHAIPEFIGNKKLFAYYECDVCNAKFSKTLESHMANYMNLYHTISQVKGKKGIPSFKTGKQSRVDVTDKVEIEQQHDDDFISIDEENKILTFKSKRASYVPIAVYKCLVKMALTIMPEDELVNFEHTLAWINEESHATSAYNIPTLAAQVSIASGQHPFDFITCSLFKRKDNASHPVPYMIFLLAYSNYVFQIYLPLCPKDVEIVGKDIEMVYIVTPIDIMNGSATLRRFNWNLSARELVKGEEAKITMSFERFNDTELEGLADESSAE